MTTFMLYFGAVILTGAYAVFSLLIGYLAPGCVQDDTECDSESTIVWLADFFVAFAVSILSVHLFTKGSSRLCGLAFALQGAGYIVKGFAELYFADVGAGDANSLAGYYLLTCVCYIIWTLSATCLYTLVHVAWHRTGEEDLPCRMIMSEIGLLLVMLSTVVIAVACVGGTLSSTFIEDYSQHISINFEILSYCQLGWQAFFGMFLVSGSVVLGSLAKQHHEKTVLWDLPTSMAAGGIAVCQLLVVVLLVVVTLYMVEDDEWEVSDGETIKEILLNYAMLMSFFFVHNLLLYHFRRENWRDRDEKEVQENCDYDNNEETEDEFFEDLEEKSSQARQRGIQNVDVTEAALDGDCDYTVNTLSASDISKKENSPTLGNHKTDVFSVSSLLQGQKMREETKTQYKSSEGATEHLDSSKSAFPTGKTRSAVTAMVFYGFLSSCSIEEKEESHEVPESDFVPCASKTQHVQSLEASPEDVPQNNAIESGATPPRTSKIKPLFLLPWRNKNKQSRKRSVANPIELSLDTWDRSLDFDDIQLVPYRSEESPSVASQRENSCNREIGDLPSNIVQKGDTPKAESFIHRQDMDASLSLSESLSAEDFASVPLPNSASAELSYDSSRFQRCIDFLALGKQLLSPALHDKHQPDSTGAIQEENCYDSGSLPPKRIAKETNPSDSSELAPDTASTQTSNSIKTMDGAIRDKALRQTAVSSDHAFTQNEKSARFESEETSPVSSIREQTPSGGSSNPEQEASFRWHWPREGPVSHKITRIFGFRQYLLPHGSRSTKTNDEVTVNSVTASPSFPSVATRSNRSSHTQRNLQQDTDPNEGIVEARKGVELELGLGPTFVVEENRHTSESRTSVFQSEDQCGLASASNKSRISCFPNSSSMPRTKKTVPETDQEVFEGTVENSTIEYKGKGRFGSRVESSKWNNIRFVDTFDSHVGVESSEHNMHTDLVLDGLSNSSKDTFERENSTLMELDQNDVVVSMWGAEKGGKTSNSRSHRSVEGLPCLDTVAVDDCSIEVAAMAPKRQERKRSRMSRIFSRWERDPGSKKNELSLPQKDAAEVSELEYEAEEMTCGHLSVEIENSYGIPDIELSLGRYGKSHMEAHSNPELQQADKHNDTTTKELIADVSKTVTLKKKEQTHDVSHARSVVEDSDRAPKSESINGAAASTAISVTSNRCSATHSNSITRSKEGSQIIHNDASLYSIPSSQFVVADDWSQSEVADFDNNKALPISMTLSKYSTNSKCKSYMPQLVQSVPIAATNSLPRNKQIHGDTQNQTVEVLNQAQESNNIMRSINGSQIIHTDASLHSIPSSQFVVADDLSQSEVADFDNNNGLSISRTKSNFSTNSNCNLSVRDLRDHTKVNKFVDKTYRTQLVRPVGYSSKLETCLEGKKRDWAIEVSRAGMGKD